MKRIRKRYNLPDGLDVKSVVMRELDADDDIESAIWADANANSALQGSAIAAIQGDKKESIRISLVEVDGEPVNQDGVPYKGMDRWSHRTMIFIEASWMDLNGVDTSDLKKAVQGGAIQLLSEPQKEDHDAPPSGE